MAAKPSVGTLVGFGAILPSDIDDMGPIEATA
jgi:hypothetical protein